MKSVADRLLVRSLFCALCVKMISISKIFSYQGFKKTFSARKRWVVRKDFKASEPTDKCLLRFLLLECRRNRQYGTYTLHKKSHKKYFWENLPQVRLNTEVRQTVHFTLRKEFYSFKKTIIKGDEKEPVIGAASMWQKSHRDKMMVNFRKNIPSTAFEKAQRLRHPQCTKKAIRAFGLTPIHRRSL